MTKYDGNSTWKSVAVLQQQPKILDEYWPDFWQTLLIKPLISQWCAIKYSSKNVLRAYVAAKLGLIINITAKANDTTDILQTFR